MKKSVYNVAYKFVSWFSEITGGAAVLVRWKIALAVVILGFSAGSLVGCEPATCYDPAPPPDDEQEQSDDTGDGGEEQTARFTE